MAAADRLGQDADDVEPGDRPGVPRGLLLRHAEVGGDGDDRLLHRFAGVRRGVGRERRRTSAEIASGV